MNSDKIKNNNVNDNKYLFRELTEKEITKVYYEQMTFDFPKCELKPLQLLLDCKNKGVYECFGLYEAEKLLSYSFFAYDDKKEISLLDYLAVVKDYRNIGLGSIMLKKIKEYFKENTSVIKIIIEAESTRTSKNSEEERVRERRISFYEKNGLIMQNFMANVFGTEFVILVLNVYEDEIEADVIEEGYKNVYKAILPRKMYDNNIFII